MGPSPGRCIASSGDCGSDEGSDGEDRVDSAVGMSCMFAGGTSTVGGSFFSKPFILWLAARKKSAADCFGVSSVEPFVEGCFASIGDGSSLGVEKLAGVVLPELLCGGIVARSGGRFLSGS